MYILHKCVHTYLHIYKLVCSKLQSWRVATLRVKASHQWLSRAGLSKVLQFLSPVKLGLRGGHKSVHVGITIVSGPCWEVGLNIRLPRTLCGVSSGD